MKFKPGDLARRPPRRDICIIVRSYSRSRAVAPQCGGSTSHYIYWFRSRKAVWVDEDALEHLTLS